MKWLLTSPAGNTASDTWYDLQSIFFSTWISQIICPCFFFGKQKQNHKDKVPHEEEAALKDPAIRKAVKAAAAEVEKTEGRGQIKVRLHTDVL